MYSKISLFEMLMFCNLTEKGSLSFENLNIENVIVHGRRPPIDHTVKTNLHKNICPEKESHHLFMAFIEGLTSQDFNRNDLSITLFLLSIFLSVMADELSVTECCATLLFNKQEYLPFLLIKQKLINMKCHLSCLIKTIFFSINLEF